MIHVVPTTRAAAMFRVLFSTLILIGFSMADTCNNSLADFYPNSKCNLTEITWAHAVNSQAELSGALNDTNILMIEADIVLGTLSGSPTADEIPIMGHPPANTSDLSLAAFLEQITLYNKNTSSPTKGAKLDFKSIEALESSNSIITSANVTYPLLINADIIAGPLNATTVPVNPTRFFAQAKDFPNAMLSVGWTTNYGANISASYTNDQIQDMVTSLEENNVTQEVTFPVRAGIAAESVSLLKDLVGKVNSSTLTIWSSDGDNVNVEHLRDLIRAVGVDKVFVDVPTSLMSQLHLESLSSGSLSTAFVATVVASLCFLMVF